MRPAIAEKNGVQHPEPEEKTKGIPKDICGWCLHGYIVERHGVSDSSRCSKGSV